MSKYRIANWRAHNANNLDAIKDLADNSIDSIVTDPPYEIAFMGRDWDNSGQAYNEQLWRECLRVLKPGGHLIAFGATRTIHRTTSAIEASGFEIRDLISWLYFSGFPKSLDISKAIDKHFGADREVIGQSENGIAGGEKKHCGNLKSYGFNGKYNITAPSTQEAQQWNGFGTALKPAQEPAVLARKPIEQGSIAKQVLSTGTGALNIDGCRFGYGDECWVGPQDAVGGRSIAGWCNAYVGGKLEKPISTDDPGARWRANIYQCPKPNRDERDAGLEHLDGDIKNVHPTVKPIKLMRWLCRLITPPSGTVLDPFAGSGTTLAAAILEGFDVIGFELTAEYMPIIEGRCQWAIEEYKRENAQLSMLDWMEASK
jgi:site-specific DNA-methyltransferase (adenine-specific)